MLERNGNAVGIEVKSGKRGMNNGLALFKEKFNPKRSFVVGTNGIAVEEFLLADLGRLF